VTRRFSVLNTSAVRALVVLGAVCLAALACAASAGALTFTAGDPVVYRVGTGAETLAKDTAASAFLDEFSPGGSVAGSIAFPTSESGASKRLTASGTGSSEGLLTLSGNGNFLLATGYNAALGTVKLSETLVTGTKPVARVVGRVSKTGEVNTTTALINTFGNGNNPRSATSQEGENIYVGGAGKSTTGGVHFTKLGEEKSKPLNTTDTNVRQVEVFDGQLYTSADPTKNGVIIAKVGTGLPTTEGQSINNLPFETEGQPKQPYQFAMLTVSPLNKGSGAPDTIYVADDERNAVVKYCLESGVWKEFGSVEVPFVRGVIANDNSGVVTLYATGSEQGIEGTLYKISDVSGFGGTFTDVAEEIAKAPLNEGYRGLAWAPGTTIGEAGTPPSAPTIKTEGALAAAIGDPTNPTDTVTIGDSEYAANSLTVTVHSSNEEVAPQANISVTGSGTERQLHVTPAAVGESKLSVTVEALNGATKSALVHYGASANLGNAADRYYDGAGNASTAIDVGGGYMVVGDDESNILRLYRERHSSEPVKTYNFTNVMPDGQQEMDIEASARDGNMLYWMGSESNSHHGEVRPATDVVFAAKITGSGASTALEYVGSYTHLREDIIEWDNNNGKPFGLSASAEEGSPSDLPTGFNIEGVEFAAGSEEEAYVTFRAPLEPTSKREKALMVPVKNFGDLVKHGNPGLTKATFGTAMEWNLGGLGMREIRKNEEGEYLIIAGQSEEVDTSFALYGWDGNTEDEPILLETPVPGLVAEGAWESIVSVPEPIESGDEVELLEDNGDTEWYESKLTSKNGLTEGLQKDLGRLFTIHIPAPSPSGPPHLQTGTNPNAGKFSIRWKPSSTLRARFKLQHENAEGGWTTVASNLSSREYTFNPESEGTWKYRVKESNPTAEAEFSTESEAIKVDRTAPNTPTPHASREPDYAGKGGWYKDSMTVSFTANGDPTLADGSSPSGVEPSSLTSPKTYNTSGSFNACGEVEDKVGNLSSKGCLTVQVDATAPSLEISCPATAVQGENVHATVTASDGQSGLASDPSGNVPINTATTGPFTVTRTAIDNVGHETTKSCTTEVVYPTPGAPAITAGGNPNNGHFTLTWTGANPMSNVGLTYTLQHRPISSGTWTTVASGLESLSYEFPKSAKEAEGTWLYRVQGADSVNLKQTEFSPESPAVVVGLPPELGHCVPAPTEVNSKGKTVGTGAFSKNSCAALNKKHAGLYNWEGGVTKGHVTSNETGVVQLIAANKFKVECRGSISASGEFVSARRVEGLTFKFSECGSVLGRCTSAGSLEGKITTKTLEGVLGVYKASAKPAGNKAGLEVYPVGKTGPFAEYSCGSKKMTVKGAVILPIRANKVTPTLEVSARASKGKQKAEAFVEGEPKAQLEVSVESEPAEPVGLTMNLHLETEEALELNTVA